MTEMSESRNSEPLAAPTKVSPLRPSSQSKVSPLRPYGLTIETFKVSPLSLVLILSLYYWCYNQYGGV